MMWRRSVQRLLSSQQEEESTDWTCWCRCWRRHRVYPLPSGLHSSEVEMVQVKPHRILRVIHLLPETKHDLQRLMNGDAHKMSTEGIGNGTVSHVTDGSCKTKLLEIDDFADCIARVAIAEALACFHRDDEPEPFNPNQHFVDGIVNPSFIGSTTDVSHLCNGSAHVEDENANDDDNVSSLFDTSTWGSSKSGSVCVRVFRSASFQMTTVKPVLFFIHGIGNSADVWEMQTSYFSNRGYRTVALDLIGHGYSSAPHDPQAYLFQQILSDVLHVFDRFSQGNNVVVGHSYGSSFAASLARQRSHQITHLVLISGGGPIGLRPRSGPLTKCLMACVEPLVMCGFPRDLFYSPTGRQIVCPSPFEIPSYVLTHIMRGQRWEEGNGSFYRQILVPTLLLYGLKDPLVTLVEQCEMEKVMPRAVLQLIPQASHMVMLDVPHQVNRMIHRFIKR